MLSGVNSFEIAIRASWNIVKIVGQGTRLSEQDELNLGVQVAAELHRLVNTTLYKSHDYLSAYNGGNVAPVTGTNLSDFADEVRVRQDMALDDPNTAPEVKALLEKLLALGKNDASYS